MVLLVLAIIASADSVVVQEEQGLFNLRPFAMVDLGLNFLKTTLNQRAVDYFDFEIPHGQSSAGVIGARAGLQFLGELGIYGEARAWFMGGTLHGEGGAGSDHWVNVSTRMLGGGLAFVHDFSNGKIAGIHAGLGNYSGSVELGETGVMSDQWWRSGLQGNLGVNIGILYGGPIRSETVDAYWALEFAYHRTDMNLEETYTGIEPRSEELHLFDLKVCLRYIL